jgi:hypothetical protein
MCPALKLKNSATGQPSVFELENQVKEKTLNSPWENNTDTKEAELMKNNVKRTAGPEGGIYYYIQTCLICKLVVRIYILLLLASYAISSSLFVAGTSQVSNRVSSYRASSSSENSSPADMEAGEAAVAPELSPAATALRHLRYRTASLS